MPAFTCGLKKKWKEKLVGICQRRDRERDLETERERERERGGGERLYYDAEGPRTRKVLCQHINRPLLRFSLSLSLSLSLHFLTP